MMNSKSRRRSLSDLIRIEVFLLLAVIAFFTIAATPCFAENEIIAKLRAGKKVVTLEDLFSLYSSGKEIILLDTRGLDPYKEGHLPTAISLPGWEIENRIGQLPDKTKMFLN